MIAVIISYLRHVPKVPLVSYLEGMIPISYLPSYKVALNEKTLSRETSLRARQRAPLKVPPANSQHSYTREQNSRRVTIEPL